jgi:ATP-dependent protease HslVU (ClpYQ) peptidase subunit
MTCIVGIEHDGVVTIGGDAAGTAGWERTLRSDDKAFRVGEYVMGFTSSYRMGQLLRYSFQPPTPEGWDIDRFMATGFIDAVRQTLKDGGWAALKESREEGGEFLVGVRGRLYTVHSDYQIAHSLDGYDAVGCGAEFALGVMYATQDWSPPQERIRKALEAAAHHSAGVAGPFTILSGLAMESA